MYVIRSSPAGTGDSIPEKDTTSADEGFDEEEEEADAFAQKTSEEVSKNVTMF